jgi:hypothetical protein
MEGSLVAYKVFTNGSTLQASELNENLMQQSTAVFSNAAARTAAITSPVEGQMTYLEDTNLYQHWDGSAWVSPFGLTLIKKQAVGTAVNLITVNDAFSSEFENYKILMSGGVGSSTQAIEFRLGSATSNYASSLIYSSYNNTVTALGGASQASFVYAGNQTTTSASLDIDLNSPFLATRTIVRATWASPSETGQLTGAQTDSTSFTSFNIQPQSSATLTGGNIYVYGYRSK